ncbi:MAG: ATP-binding protein [Bacteroidota bacterium]
MAKKTDENQSFLTLGWEVDAHLNPKYWLTDKPKIGSQKENDIVQIPASKLGAHTAIIAQSGSGKSFFLGRLIEEIMIKTQARCIILDPNADFKKINVVEQQKLWTEAKYNTKSSEGRLPDISRTLFTKYWSGVPKTIKTIPAQTNSTEEELKIDWQSVSIDFLIEDLSSTFRTQVYHCHKFTQCIAELVSYKTLNKKYKNLDFLEIAERILRKSRLKLREEVSAEFVVKELIAPVEEKLVKAYGSIMRSTTYVAKYLIEKNIEDAIFAAKYVTIDAVKYYFGTAQEYKSKVQFTKPNNEWFTEEEQNIKRLTVINLPSITDQRTRLLSINAIVSSEWENARERWTSALNEEKEKDTRVPTFIVIDEAHNLIPAEPRGMAANALREQFRTIIAEGRKYGLFLIIASQRPDKLDPLILSECENKVLMKLSSQSVLDLTCHVFGLDDYDPKLLSKCLDFELGRGLLLGPWVDNITKLFYCAARRTVEGGRNLRAEYWAKSSIPELNKIK